MSLSLRSRKLPSRQQQTAATLLVAIVMLLVITLLAISSMRGVSLESRITGNLKQQKILTNAAEAALRIGEDSISTSQAVSASTACNTTSCLRWSLSDLATTTNIDTPSRFTASDGGNVATIANSYDVIVQWYAVDLGNLAGSSQNNCSAKGCGVRYYEINSCASAVPCTNNTTSQRVILRSVIARNY